MADLSDVTNTLAALAAAAVYPNGTSSPSVAAIPVTIAPGWPQPAQLDAIIGAGAAFVNIYPMPGMDANTTRFPQVQNVEAIPAANLTLTVAGRTVTVGGAIQAGEAAALEWNHAYVAHAVVTGDTLAGIAAALAAQISGATSAGAVLTLPASTFEIIARVSVPVPTLTEIARQTRDFQINVWAPSPATRDQLAAAIDVALKGSVRITLPDNTYGLCRYRGTIESDDLQKQMIYRRGLHFNVEYATTVAAPLNTVEGFGSSAPAPFLV